MDFSIRLENLLEERNLSQKQLALDLHVANSTINGYVKNNREPDFGMLIRLSRYFEVSTDYLLGVSDDKELSYHDLPPDKAELLQLYDSLLPKHQKIIMNQIRFYSSPRRT